MSRRPGSGSEFEPSWPHIEPWTETAIRPLETFYYFDGPILFSADVGPFQMLFCKHDEIGSGDLFLASLVDHRMLAALGDAKLSVFGAVAYDLRFVIETEGLVPRRMWRCGIENIPMARLPKPGVASAPGHPVVPDVLPGYPAPEWASRQMRHLKRGSRYDVLCESANVQAARPIMEGDSVAVYRADDGTCWVRPVDEFNDGRFVDVGGRP
jgi:hypothetical protein